MKTLKSLLLIFVLFFSHLPRHLPHLVKELTESFRYLFVPYHDCNWLLAQRVLLQDDNTKIEKGRNLNFYILIGLCFILD